MVLLFKAEEAASIVSSNIKILLRIRICHQL